VEVAAQWLRVTKNVTGITKKIEFSPTGSAGRQERAAGRGAAESGGREVRPRCRRETLFELLQFGGRETEVSVILTPAFICMAGQIPVAMPHPTNRSPSRIDRGWGFLSFQPKRSAPSR
jgi:hypothetical protein